MKSIKTFVPLILAVGLVCIGIAVTAFANQASATPTDATEYAEYQNDEYGFSFLYPADLTVNHHDDVAGRAQSITFSDAAAGKEFLIFITPYSQLDVHGAGSQLYTPASHTDQGGELGVVNVTAGGGTITMWFVKDGMLYQVTTFDQLDTWLLDILRTWQFD